MNTEECFLLATIGQTESQDYSSIPVGDIDWPQFIKLAKAHRVMPIVYKNLSNIEPEIPDEITRKLNRFAKKCAMRNLEFVSELAKLDRTLRESGIEYLIYKGPTLAQLAFGDPSLRSFGDLDLFIRKKDFHVVKEAILVSGGRVGWDISEKNELAVIKHHYEFPFWVGKRPTFVEVHWAFIEHFFGFDFQTEDVFGRSQKVKIHGRDFQTLSNEDLLIILCVHGSKHFWKRLSWILDVGGLVGSQEIDWPAVIERSERFGCMRMLGLGLILARRLGGAELPLIMKSKIEKDPTIGSLADLTISQLFDDTITEESYRPRVHLRMRERWRDKFTYSHRLFRTKISDSLFMPMGRPR